MCRRTPEHRVLGHRDGEADGRSAVVTEHRLLRVDVGTAHLGDVTRAENRPLTRKLTALRLSSEVNCLEHGWRLVVASIDGLTGLDGICACSV